MRLRAFVRLCVASLLQSAVCRAHSTIARGDSSDRLETSLRRPREHGIVGTPRTDKDRRRSLTSDQIVVPSFAVTANSPFSKTSLVTKSFSTMDRAEPEESFNTQLNSPTRAKTGAAGRGNGTETFRPLSPSSHR